MPNWEEMAGAMTQPFGGIEQPQQKAQFNMQEMARGFMDTLRGIGTAMAPQNVSKTMAQPLVNMPPQGMWDFLLGKVPPEMMNAPVGEEEKKQLTQKAYDWVEPHLFATGGLLAGVGAKATDLLSSIRSLQPKGQERALVSISELREKLVGESVDLSRLKDDAMAIAKEYGMPLKSIEQKITKGSSTTGGLNYLNEGKIKVTADYGTEAAYMELAHELAHFVERGHNKSFEAVHKEIYEKLVARNKESDWTKKASFEPKIVESSKGKMTNAEFDDQLLKLAQEGKVFLHKHDFASSLKPEERAKLLAIPNKNAHWGGNDYYIGVVPK